MSYIEKKAKLDFLLLLITKGNCGDAACLSRRLHVSKRTIKSYISILRELGHLIHYNAIDKTYFLHISDSQTTDKNLVSKSD